MAAVFAVHPLRVESVAWVAERKDVLSGLFFMLTLWAYLGYVRHPFSLLRYLMIAVLFALGLMSKPMLVTMPFVLLLLDYWPLGRLPTSKPLVASQSLPSGNSFQPDALPVATWRRLIVEKIPLLLLAAASCVATMLVQHGSVVRLNELPLVPRFGSALVSYAAYLGQFFYPLDLAVFYPHPAARLPAWEAVAALFLLAAISLAVIVRVRRSPYLFVGWFWYLGMLVPVIGVVQVGLQAMADRYTYLPQIGLAIAVTWGAVAGGQTFLSAGKKTSYGPWAWGIASALLLAGLMACAWRQTSFWRDSESLWTHTLRCTARNDVAHFNLAAELIKQQRFGDAIEQYEATVRIRPRYPHAQCNLASALNHEGQTAEAIPHYYAALKYDRDDRFALNNLAWLRATCRRSGFRNGAEAVELAQRAVRLSNGREAALIGTLAASYAEAGRFPEAVQTARQAIDLAKRQNDQTLANDTEARLQLYINRKPYRQPAPVSPPGPSNGRPDAP